ncbi:MAG: hypothetical protein NC133_03985, partial [Prevotella sp.]|nr:hypothetical protein [Prevotella sp.]
VYPLQESALAAVEQSEFDEQALYVDILQIKATSQPSEQTSVATAEEDDASTTVAADEPIVDRLHELLAKKLTALKKALEPYLTDDEFSELMNSDPISVLEMLETLIVKLHKKDVVAAAMGIELKSFIQNKIFEYAEADMNSA